MAYLKKKSERALGEFSTRLGPALVTFLCRKTKGGKRLTVRVWIEIFYVLNQRTNR